MDSYTKKTIWKYLLAITVGATIILSLFFTNKLISSLSTSTETLSKSAASLKSSTNSLNSSMKSIEIHISKEEKSETQKVEKWAKAMNIITNDWGINQEEETSYEKKQEKAEALLYVTNEKNIPILLVDEYGEILEKKNIIFPDSINTVSYTHLTLPTKA